MFRKISPTQFVLAHWRTFKDDATGNVLIGEVLLHFVGPGLAAAGFLAVGPGISDNSASIVVSAASIASGLLLNLLVLLYTLVYNAKSAATPIKNLEAFRQVCDEALATVAYAILLSLGLVVCAFTALAPQRTIANWIGQFGVVYLGCSAVLCVLVILKRTYALVHFELRRE
jgi:hypothetical protein